MVVRIRCGGSGRVGSDAKPQIMTLFNRGRMLYGQRRVRTSSLVTVDVHRRRHNHILWARMWPDRLRHENAIPDLVSAVGSPRVVNVQYPPSRSVEGRQSFHRYSESSGLLRRQGTMAPPRRVCGQRLVVLALELCWTQLVCDQPLICINAQVILQVIVHIFRLPDISHATTSNTSTFSFDWI